MFKKDDYGLGVLLGLLAPALIFGIIRGVNYVLLLTHLANYMIDIETNIILGTLGNLFLIRYYFINLKYDKTGRGVLIITFALIIIFFGLKSYY